MQIINTLTPQTLSQQSLAMGSSKQLPSSLKIKPCPQLRDGYKKVANSSQAAASSVHYVIKKGKFKGTVEFEA